MTLQTYVPVVSTLELCTVESCQAPIHVYVKENNPRIGALLTRKSINLQTSVNWLAKPANILYQGGYYIRKSRLGRHSTLHTQWDKLQLGKIWGGSLTYSSIAGMYIQPPLFITHRVMDKPTISSAMIQPQLFSNCPPVTQSHMNLTPSRWWGRRTLESVGSTTTGQGQTQRGTTSNSLV